MTDYTYNVCTLFVHYHELYNRKQPLLLLTMLL